LDVSDLPRSTWISFICCHGVVTRSVQHEIPRCTREAVAG
jgi:hypothetical protein